MKAITHIVFASLFATFSSIGAVAAQTVTIVTIGAPELTEIREMPGDTYLYVSDLGGIRYPLKATPAANHRLIFKHKGKSYQISRADATLAGEHLVVDACRTVPVTLRADARSASVKGAGETCK